MKVNKKIKNLFIKTTSAITLLLIKCSQVFASSGSAEVEQATNNVKRAVTSIAMPVGALIILIAIIIASAKMIMYANNPQRRSESISSLAWILGGAIMLGLSIIITSVIINISTNGTGTLIGG